MGEVLRTGRYLNIPLGLAVGAGIWFADNTTPALGISSLVAGVLVILLAVFRGSKTESYAGWDKHVR